MNVLDVNVPTTGLTNQNFGEVPSLLADMPVGVEVGTLVHRVFEAVDFTATDLSSELSLEIASAQARRRAGELRPDVTLVDIYLGEESGVDLAWRLEPGVGRGAAGHQDLPVVEQVELTGELVVRQHAEDLRQAVRVGIEQLDPTLQDEEEVDAALAAVE